MRFKNIRGQASVEMAVIIGAIVVPIVVIVGAALRLQMIKFGDKLKSNLQCQIRYGVSERTAGVTAQNLGKKETYGILYEQQQSSSMHPLKNVAIGW